MSSENLLNNIAVTVGELIEQLKKYPSDMPIQISDADGGRYDVVEHYYAGVDDKGGLNGDQKFIRVFHLEAQFIDRNYEITDENNVLSEEDKYILRNHTIKDSNYALKFDERFHEEKLIVARTIKKARDGGVVFKQVNFDED